MHIYNPLKHPWWSFHAKVVHSFNSSAFFAKKENCHRYLPRFSLHPCKTKGIKLTRSFFILHIFIKIFNELGYLPTKNYGCNFLSQFFQWFYEFTTSLWIYFECHSQISLLKLLFMLRLILIELKKMKNKKQGKSSIFFSLRYFHCLNHSFFLRQNLHSRYYSEF